MVAFEMQAGAKKGKPSQDLIPIEEIRDGVLIMKDSSIRAVLLVSSINFALKSADEQDAIIYAYQDFLNSLDFPLQMVISSRKMDITPYLEQVKALKEKQENELLRLQMDEYIRFVEDLVKGSNIMTKTFFVVIPFSVTQSRKETPWGRVLKGAKGAAGGRKMSDTEFEHNRAQLFQRVSQVASGLQSIGLRIVPLNTQELLEMYYAAYNPATSRNQKLRDVGQLKVQEFAS